MRLPQPGEVYQHYKGGIYKVLGLGRHTETEEPVVIYESMDSGAIWVRPVSSWLEPVPLPKPGSTISRFQIYVGVKPNRFEEQK